ncbi:hypothetical protein JOE33_000171 [Pseudomonas sp. PvP027]|uniref:hypothetical protein n=1 Tax=Pseudomonas sp. PvP027 TaxID=2806587 RepID=UPI001AE4691A|nr:hypothetical protein [Pseudomonas sp. PvP027]MBP1143226.1 hypothetical protein [Pseudomonas sp. PvP027]MBP1143237.1 hypothetical protein [Pseudomonas sp. PvP027]MBP1143248.1 hypothetical protein [Pseudomonas sp. PvP027]
MLIKITDADPDFVEKLKSLTSKNTGAKAYAHAAECYGMYVTANALAVLEIDQLKDEISRLRAVIEGARSAAALLLEKTGQLDLLD